MEMGNGCLGGNYGTKMAREYNLGQLFSSFVQAYSLYFGLFLWSLPSHFDKWSVVGEIHFDTVG